MLVDTSWGCRNFACQGPKGVGVSLVRDQRDLLMSEIGISFNWLLSEIVISFKEKYTGSGNR